MPLAVNDGRCSCVLATPRPDEKYLLILGSLSPTAGPHQVAVRTTPHDGPAALTLDKPTVDDKWTRQIAATNERLARARQASHVLVGYGDPGRPARERDFHLFIKERDFQEADGYATVHARLAAVGVHCQAYVDRDHADASALQPTIDEAVNTFDQDVYPWASAHLGHTLDVDRDGRFTILFTGWLDKLSSGKVALSGFVRGSDFYRDLAAPFGNRCDMMFLNTNLKPGPYLRSLLAHEYTHAVVFCEHVFGGYLSDVPCQEEESWLNEGLAHVVEALHGHGWSNLDYRLSAFLNEPERHQLVVPDYYTAGLWRTPGNRGAAYLFLRWCLERHGKDLPGRLVQSNLSGIANLEAATGRPFAELFRAWCIDLAGQGVPRPVGCRLLCGPRHLEMNMAEGRKDVTLAGTSMLPILLHSPAGACTRLTVTSPAAAALQVTLIRLPSDSARLTLLAERDSMSGGVRLHLTAHDADVTLTAAAWERLEVKESRAADSSYWPEQTQEKAVSEWFGATRLKADETLHGTVSAIPAGTAIVFKITGVDPAGQAVTAWAVVEN
jgi:hypothetical protein